MSSMRIGWAQVDITPDQPVQLAGQFNARVSEGVADPVTATALALDSGEDHAVLVSCDLVGMPDELRDAVRAQAVASCPDLDPMKVVLNITHTHTAPDIRPRGAGNSISASGPGVELDAMDIAEYVAFAVERIAGAVAEAWNARAEGQVAFGQGTAVVGRTRRWVNKTGESTMYGDTNTPDFAHIEGYEDHSLGVLATRDAEGRLTGLIVNVPCPSQETEGMYVVSADYWHETRIELRRRLGEGLFVLPQCSVAGDQSPHLIYDKKPHLRMLALKGRTMREEIAQRIANGVEETLGWLGSEFDSAPLLTHRYESLELPLAALTQADVDTALREAEALREKYEEEVRKLNADPDARKNPRWYVPATFAFRRMNWFLRVKTRYEGQQHSETMPSEVHVIRLGDAVIATNAFEYYQDYGIRIKARSKATQTFLVQLAGSGTYVPSPRSTAGGGYGSIPASNPVGPEGGDIVAETTIGLIDGLWAEK